MVDYFNTNWTQQMKINPVANMILNGKPQPDSEYLEFRKVRRLKKEGPITLGDLFKNSSSISRRYDYQYIEDVVGGDDWREMADDMKATPVDDFMDIENKKPYRAKAIAKAKAKAKKDARALRRRRKHRKQGQIEQQQQQAIEIDINAIDNDGLFENIRQDNDRMVNDMVVAHDKQTGVMAQLVGDQAKEKGDDAIAIQTVAIDIDGIDDRREQRPNQFLRGKRQRHMDPGYDSDNVDLDDEKGNLENIDMGYGSSDDDYVDIDGGINLGFRGPYHGESGMWDNTYVKDYLNIHHPKLLPDYYIQALKQQPLQIKPPSVFFSDV